MRWLAATMDPNFYTALFTTLTDPGKTMRWAMLPMDPKLWGMMLNTLNPGMYMKWMMAPLDPRAIQLMTAPFNPTVYLGWLGAGMDPKTYGPMWAGFLNPALPALPANPWGGIPYSAGLPNPFDPNALMGMFGMPAPATVPAAPATAPAVPAVGTAPTVTPAPAPKAAAPAEAPKVAEAPKPAVTVAPVATVPLPAAAKPAEAVKSESLKVAEAPKAAETPKVAETAKPAETAKTAAPLSKVVLSGDALFGLNKSGIRELSKEGKQRLDEVAEKIKALGEVEQIKIVGHADATGKAEANRKLSEARARSVKSYLVAKGVKPSVIITSGMGDTQPLVQCDMQQPKDKLVECLAPNRRVEIEVIGKAK
jgi:outer membrane protein OmpA-like peptidoglycan-associated protein